MGEPKKSKLFELQEQETKLKKELAEAKAGYQLELTTAQNDVERLRKECFRNDPDLAKVRDEEIDGHHLEYLQQVNQLKAALDTDIALFRQKFESARKEVEAKYGKLRDEANARYKSQQVQKRESTYTELKKAERHLEMMVKEQAAGLSRRTDELDKLRTEIEKQREQAAAAYRKNVEDQKGKHNGVHQ